jgi:hypothetical protein
LTVWQEGLVLLAQSGDHAGQAAVFGVQVAHVLGVLLIAVDADGMASGDLMFVSFDIFGDFFWGVLVQEPDRAS